MRTLLLAAVAAWALGGSAYAMDANTAAGKGRVIGLLYQASQECDASYDPQGMSNLANSIYVSLQRQHPFSDEEIIRQVGFGAGVFHETAREDELKAACDSVIPAYAKARATLNKYH